MVKMPDQPPHRLVFIRHAEKPHNGISGVDEQGNADAESLIPLGWQRAGALVGLLAGRHEQPGQASLVPDVIYAAGVGAGSPSKRSMQTVTPLARALAPGGVQFVTTYLKEDHEGLAADVASRSGVVLIAWEHKQIPAIAALLAPGADTPTSWPERFDLMWIYDRVGGSWSFSERSQALLAGDEPEPAS
jgi:hypothetical protein